jgi:multidrug resistance efflux pump
MPSSLFLGELNASYYTFYNSYSKHKDYYLKKPFDKEIETTNQLIESRKSILNNLFSEKSRLQKKYDLAVSLFRKDSLLAEKRLVSTSDLEKMTMSKLSVEQEFKAIDKEIINVNYQIEDGKNRIQQIMVQKMSAEREIEINLNASYYNLVENLHEWKKKYLITSPIKGKIEFLSFLKEDDFIQTGQELFSIVPPENEILGQMYLPEIGSGKVKIGQEVIIKLNNYPYLQFGSIKGQISRISVVSNQQLGATGKVATSLYLVNVKLVNGLQTNYGKNLPYQFDLKGSGEIITEEKRLIERFFDNLKYRIK